MRGALLLLLALIGCTFAARAAGDIAVVRVYGADDAQIARIGRRHSHMLVDRTKGVIVLEADADERKRIAAIGLSFEVDEPATRALHEPLRLLPGQKAGIVGFPCYRTVVETNARLDALAAQYPALASIVDIGDSWEKTAAQGGEDLRVIRLTSSVVAGQKPVMFLMTGIHAREYTPAELSLRFVERLLAGYGLDADATWILDQHEIHVLVQSNPDGRKRAELGQLWRKNTNQGYCGATSSSRGADLNRNFPFEWGMHNGSSPVACQDTYRGPAPMSEPETTAVVNYVRNVIPDQRGGALNDPAPVDTQGMFLDLHSYSSLVLWPWGFDQIVAPNGAALETLGRRFAWFNGYTPQQAIDLYPTDGTTDDFAYGELGVPAYTFELGNQFFESCNAFESTIAPDNLDALLYAAKVTRRPYQLPAGPETRALIATPDLALVGEPVTLSATFDDSRFNQSSGGAQPVHAIAGGDAWIGTTPWLGTTPDAAFVASDGAFNGALESASATLPTAGIASGRELVYVQGRDASGANGPVSATWIDVRTAAEIGTLSGTVRDANTGAPLVADVRAGAYRTTSAASGAYQRRVLPGTYALSASANGYETLQAGDATLAGGASLARDFALFPLCTRLAEDAEGAGTGWVPQTPWGRVGPNAVATTRAWTESPAGNYTNNLDTSLTAPTFSLTGYSDAVLAFDSYCATEAGWDFGIVEVRAATSGAWAEVFRCDDSPTWTQVEIALPQLEGAAQAQLRFRFTSDTSQVRDGWYVDGITLRAGGEACRASGDLMFSHGFE